LRLLISKKDPCETRDGRAGICSAFRNCQQAYEDHKKGIQVTFCNNGWICCASQSQVSPPLNIQKPRPSQGISSSSNFPSQRISEKSNTFISVIHSM
jgi:hypothetical protein